MPREIANSLWWQRTENHRDSEMKEECPSYQECKYSASENPHRVFYSVARIVCKEYMAISDEYSGCHFGWEEYHQQGIICHTYLA